VGQRLVQHRGLELRSALRDSRIAG
jgi:hypothetical protein